MAITLNLSPDTERRLRENAARVGETLESYLEQIVAADSESRTGAGWELSQILTEHEFEHALKEFSEGLPPLPPLPPVFGRADIYPDHD